MRRFFFSVLLTLAFSVRLATAQPLDDGGPEVVRYDGMLVAHIDASTPADLDRLEGIGATLFSCELSPDGGDFIMTPEMMDRARALGFQAEVVEADLQASVDRENARIRASLERYRQRGEGGEGFFGDYRPLPEINGFVDELVARRPDLVSRFEVGTSHEGRPIWGMRISAGEPGCKPAFVLNGVTHAREWLTVMNVLYLAEQLVEGYGVDPEITDIVDRIEWLVIPVLNPDGYEYTWTTERFWRKNRRLPPEGSDQWGVDLNRNYSVRWGLAGSSGSPASGTYRGQEPFSEPETTALRDFVLDNPQVRAHNDTHSFSNLVLFPWAQLTSHSPDHEEYQALGDAMVERIVEANNGDASWVAGPLSTTLYRISGGSTDWFYDEAGAMTFLYELRGGRFDPSIDEIIPGSRDTFRATLLHAAYVADRSSFRADLDGDCDFDFDDVLAFVVAFGSSDPAADIDGNDSFDIDDVLAFLEAFAEMR